MGFAGQVFAARVAIGLAMPSPRALTQAGSALANFSGKVYKSLNQQATRAASDRLRLAKQDLQRANKALSNLNKEHDNSLRKQAQNSIKKTNAMFGDAAFKTKKSIGDFQKYVTKVQPAAAPRMFAGMNKDMSAAKQYQRMVTNFIGLGKEERKVILNNMKARSLAMKTQAKDFKDLVNAMKPSGGGGGGTGPGGVNFMGKPPAGGNTPLIGLTGPTGGGGGGNPGWDAQGRRTKWSDFILSLGMEAAFGKSDTNEGAIREQEIADVIGLGINEELDRSLKKASKDMQKVGEEVVKKTAEHIGHGAQNAVDDIKKDKKFSGPDVDWTPATLEIMGQEAYDSIQASKGPRALTTRDDFRKTKYISGENPSMPGWEKEAAVYGNIFERILSRLHPVMIEKPWMTPGPNIDKWGRKYHGTSEEDPQGRPGYEWGSGVDPTRWPEHARESEKIAKSTKETAENTEKTDKLQKSITESVKEQLTTFSKKDFDPSLYAKNAGMVDNAGGSPHRIYPGVAVMSGDWTPNKGGAGGGEVPIDEAAGFLDDIAEQYKHLSEIDRERNDQLKLDLREIADLEEWRKQAEKELTDATKELADADKQLADETQRVVEETQQAIYMFKGEFMNAIRETISALAGFFYQLQSLTQELVEFERELLNANSVFNLTRDELFETGEAITQFGQEFGMSMQNGATGLYQLASAGVTANEALSILPNTLKLSMAVQGDHNTISKLTAQTLFGFSLPMSQAAEVTDKFAYAIQKSLIEYQDLASAIKFALPFFTATGQSLDQLLGALQVLTNRALEAGIAGRGLRQALSEFAEKSDDNAAAFRKVGLEILNMDGTMKELTVIAKEYAEIVGEDAVASTELLTSLIQDLNVRGATAFIHLVQNADEFAQAVEDTTNAGGELDQMVQIQNESIAAQIQILKNNVQAIFFMRDASFEGTEYLNGFHKAVLDFVETLKNLLVVELQDGSYALTEFAQTIQDIAVKAIEQFTKASQKVVEIIEDFTAAGFFNISMLKAFFAPLMAVLKVIKMLGPDVLKLYISFRIYSRILGLEAIPYTKILSSAFSLMKMGAGFLSEAIQHLVKSIKYYTIAVAGGEGATVATELWAGSLDKVWGLLKGLVKVLFSWQAVAIAAVGIMAIAASTANDWSNIVGGLSDGFKELIATLWVGLEPLIISIQNAREAFGGWLGDVTGMESRMVLIRTMQEIGAFLGSFVQLSAKVLGFFIDIGVEIGKWFAGSLGPDSHFDHFVQFWQDWVNPEVDINWGQAWTHTLDFFADMAGALISALVWAWNTAIDFIRRAAEKGAEVITETMTSGGLQFEYTTSDGTTFKVPVLIAQAAIGTSYETAQGGGPVGSTSIPYQHSGLTQNEQMARDYLMFLINQGADRIPVGMAPGGGYEYGTSAGSGTPAVFHTRDQPLLPQQGGGSVPRYMGGGGPLLVGELGPEIFVPSTSGRIVSNKDLNTRRTRSMLNDWRDRGATGGSGASVMSVGTLVSANSISKNSKISIDSYAGVV